MKLFQLSILPLCLVLVSGMAGCTEQEEKSKAKGKAVIDTMKNAEKSVNDAVSKMQEKMDPLEEETK